MRLDQRRAAPAARPPRAASSAVPELAEVGRHAGFPNGSRAASSYDLRPQDDSRRRPRPRSCGRRRRDGPAPPPRASSSPGRRRRRRRPSRAIASAGGVLELARSPDGRRSAQSASTRSRVGPSPATVSRQSTSSVEALLRQLHRQPRDRRPSPASAGSAPGSRPVPAPGLKGGSGIDGRQDPQPPSREAERGLEHAAMRRAADEDAPRRARPPPARGRPWRRPPPRSRASAPAASAAGGRRGRLGRRPRAPARMRASPRSPSGRSPSSHPLGDLAHRGPAAALLRWPIGSGRPRSRQLPPRRRAGPAGRASSPRRRHRRGGRAGAPTARSSHRGRGCGAGSRPSRPPTRRVPASAGIIAPLSSLSPSDLAPNLLARRGCRDRRWRRDRRQCDRPRRVRIEAGARIDSGAVLGRIATPRTARSQESGPGARRP